MKIKQKKSRGQRILVVILIVLIIGGVGGYLLWINWDYITNSDTNMVENDESYTNGVEPDEYAPWMNFEDEHQPDRYDDMDAPPVPPYGPTFNNEQFRIPEGELET